MRSPSQLQCGLPPKRAAAIRVCTFALFAATCVNATPQQIASLKLQKILGGKHACIAGNRSVQFISEDELLLLAGPDSNCYRNVNDLELVVISTRGRVIARKPWPSTFP